MSKSSRLTSRTRSGDSVGPKYAYRSATCKAFNRLSRRARIGLPTMLSMNQATTATRGQKRNSSACFVRNSIICWAADRSAISSARLSEHPPPRLGDLHPRDLSQLAAGSRADARAARETLADLGVETIIYSLRLLQVWHEQAVGHALLKGPDHRRLACRDRDCQRLARRRSELDDIGPIALRAEDHDPVVASHYRRLVLCHSSSASRFTAGAAGSSS